MKEKDYKEMEHLLLLFAILIRDDEPTERRGTNTYNEKGALCMYDMEDNERLVGVFNTTSSCSKKLGIKKEYIMTLLTPLRQKNLYKGRYKFRRVKI